MTCKYERIFASLDRSETQRNVCERAIEIASKYNADLFLGHVVDAVPSEASKGDLDLIAITAEKHLREELADLIEAAEADSNIKSVTVKAITGGLPEAVLNQLASLFNPDLVVCANRGFSGIRYAFVGSVSSYLIRNAECDVLVVK